MNRTKYTGPGIGFLDGRYVNVTGDTMQGDLDFDGYKAIAMVCDNGTTFPVSPTTGQWFLHTPTGRQYLYQWNGTAWFPIASLSSSTCYIDFALGTDSQDKGWGTGTDAYATLQYALNEVPLLYSGIQNFYCAAGTYSTANTILPTKHAVAREQIVVYGATTTLVSFSPTSAVAGTGGTQGTITLSGAGWTTNAYQNKILYCLSGTHAGQYRVIDSNTTDTLTIVQLFDSGTPLASDVWEIHDWATFFSTPGLQTLTANRTLTSYQFIECFFKGAFTIQIANQSVVQQFTACWIDCHTTRTCGASNLSRLQIFFSVVYHASNANGILAQGLADVLISRTKIVGVNAPVSGIQIQQKSICTIAAGSIIDGFPTGIFSIENSYVGMNTNSAGGFNIIRNCSTAISATTGGRVTNITNNVYQNNKKNLNEDLGSFGYINGTTGDDMVTTYDVVVNKNLTWNGNGRGFLPEYMRINESVPRTTISAASPYSPKTNDFWVDIN